MTEQSINMHEMSHEALFFAIVFILYQAHFETLGWADGDLFVFFFRLWSS